MTLGYSASAEIAEVTSEFPVGLGETASDLFVTYHSTMCYCTAISGRFGPTLEATEVRFYDREAVPDEEWHQDARMRVQRAHDFWLENVRGI